MLLNYRRSSKMSKFGVIIVICCCTVLAQEKKSEGLTSDFLNSAKVPKIGYAPGIHQAVANTGAQPNPANIFPALNGLVGNGQSEPLGTFSGLAQAGQKALIGLAEVGGRLFSAALQPFQQLAQDFFEPRSATGPVQGPGDQGLFGDVIGRSGNLTGLHTAGQQVEANVISKSKA
ncbi:uncharacterized protein LOC111264363 [Varroa jacobsoni]|uniref:Uncharacterized protein n=1 Tax=Varroa destructor TaxID=109461 RepID=A0A7M7KUI0_VARDE|nr:uncharacterized protein LOC111254385 [Varroa destructor]XP_022695938.1 uncharacterized protein LOC111264363 [Varroa jacobsoni]